MSEMVERIAMAIFPFRGGTLSWMDAKEEDREYARQEARVAIEAMREPTDEMLIAGGENVAGEDRLPVSTTWPVMIDAALQR